jgi:hypothetical protein
MSTYRRGAYNCICDVCGFQFKSDEMRERYDGMFVCREDYEGKHPLEFTRFVNDNQTVPRHAPEPDPIYIEVDYNE